MSGTCIYGIWDRWPPGIYDPCEGVTLSPIPDIVIPARLEAIPSVSFEIEQCMRTAGFCDEEILDMQLAVEEGISNTIRHGYRGNPGSITIHCDAGPDFMTVEIADDAPAFDPLEAPDPDITASLDDRDIGGLGIFLVRRVTDAVAYRYERGRNILSLMKKRKKPGPE